MKGNGLGLSGRSGLDDLVRLYGPDDLFGKDLRVAMREIDEKREIDERYGHI